LKIIKCLFAAGVVVLFSCAQKGGTMLIQPDSAAVSYSGRIDFSDRRAPVFDWPGVMISAVFANSQNCSVILDDSGGNDFNVFINGVHGGIIECVKGEKEYVISKSLAPGENTVTLTKRTESYDGITVFKGFVVDKGAKPGKPADEPKLKIEFIGDSLTVGYGVEGPGISCDSVRKYTNNHMGFAATAARALNGGFHIIAVSGRGLVKNYGENSPQSERPLPFYYESTLMNRPEVKWDFKLWVPDVVVINLGTNDFSAEPKPAAEQFINAYTALIEKVRGYYPEAAIFICEGPAQSEPFFDYFDAVLRKHEGKNVHALEMQMLKPADWACDYHPNRKAAERMAGEAVEGIKRILNL